MWLNFRTHLTYQKDIQPRWQPIEKSKKLKRLFVTIVPILFSPFWLLPHVHLGGRQKKKVFALPALTMVSRHRWKFIHTYVILFVDYSKVINFQRIFLALQRCEISLVSLCDERKLQQREGLRLKGQKLYEKNFVSHSSSFVELPMQGGSGQSMLIFVGKQFDRKLKCERGSWIFTQKKKGNVSLAGMGKYCWSKAQRMIGDPKKISRFRRNDDDLLSTIRLRSHFSIVTSSFYVNEVNDPFQSYIVFWMKLFIRVSTFGAHQSRTERDPDGLATFQVRNGDEIEIKFSFIEQSHCSQWLIQSSDRKNCSLVIFKT